MSQHAAYSSSKTTTAWSDLWRSLARRIVAMVLLWLALGGLVGVLTAPPDGGVIGLLAGAVAGMIVLSIPGVIFGLLGGRWQETLLGAACGLAVGSVSALVYGSLSAGLCLLIGACAGATFPQFFQINVLLAGRLSS